jgi:cell wall-associated NlpC family hydrolase
LRRCAVLLALLTALFAAGLAAQPAGAAVAAAPGAASAAAYGGSAAGNAALNWAEAHATGCWYAYGGTGPCGAGYDCSGLVYEAFLHIGINITRDTYTMLASGGGGHFRWIPLSQARRGDVLFYSSGHVEIMTIWYHTSYGAQQTGTRVGWHTWSGWWQPTSAYRVYLVCS